MLYPSSSCRRSGSPATTSRGTARRCVSWARSQAATYSRITPSRGRSVVLAPPPCQMLPDVERDRPCRHLGVGDLVAPGRSPPDPAVAPGDEPGGAVGFGEVVQRPHRVEHDVGVVRREGVDALVLVEHLRPLAGADLDAGRRRELVVPEQPVEHAEQQRMQRRGVEGPRLGEQRVDPLGAVPLELVAAHAASTRARRAARCEPGRPLPPAGALRRCSTRRWRGRRGRARRSLLRHPRAPWRTATLGSPRPEPGVPGHRKDVDVKDLVYHRMLLPAAERYADKPATLDGDVHRSPSPSTSSGRSASPTASARSSAWRRPIASR